MLDDTCEPGVDGPEQPGTTLDLLLAKALRKHFALGQRLSLGCQDLLILATLQARGITAVKELKRQTAIPPSTLTSVIDRLEERRLVRRWRSPDDRRSVLLEGTDEATSLLRDYERALLDGLLSETTAADRAALLGELEGAEGAL